MIINRAELLAAFATAATIEKSRTPKDILKWASLVFSVDMLTVTATDMEIWATRTVPVSDGKAHVCLLPISMTRDALNKLDCEDVEIDILEDAVTISGDGASYSIHIMEPDEFPTCDSFDWEHVCDVGASDFAAAAKLAARSVNEHNSSLVQGGILLDSADGAVHLVSTNSIGMGVAKLDAAGEAECEAIVPAKSVAAVASHMSDGKLSIDYHTNAVQFTGENTVLVSRLCEGKFPKWRKVVEMINPAVTWEITRSELVKLTSRSLVMSDVETRTADFRAEAGKLTVSSRSTSGGSVSSIDVAYDDDAKDWVYDPGILNKSLAAMSGDDVTLSMSDNGPLRVEAGNQQYFQMSCSRER